MIEWIQNNEPLLWWLAAASLIMFLGALLTAPWVVSRIPDDYFARRQRPPILHDTRHPALRTGLLILRNALGLVLLLFGLLMLLTPGQGVLTILVGIMLLNFPGKYRLERWLVSRRPVLRSINWLRRRRGRPPLKLG